MQTQLNSKLKPVVDVYEAQVQPRVRKLTSNPKFVKVKLFAQKVSYKHLLIQELNLQLIYHLKYF